MEKLDKVRPGRIVTGEDLNALVDVINALVEVVKMQSEILDKLKPVDARRTHTEDRRGAKPL